MSFTRVYSHLWMQLPREERLLLAERFDLNRTGVSEIWDDRVVSDGYSDEDLAEITAEKMAEYVGSEESFPRLWELTAAKAHAELNPPLGTITVPESEGDRADEVVIIEDAPKPTVHAKSTKKK